MNARDTFCSHCGTAFAPGLPYPRRCANASCGITVWANPIPVAVALVPVREGTRTGLLVVRRAIEPRRGKLALVGGFVEAHESWQQAAAREVREETGVVIDPAGLAPLWYASSEPRPDRVLLFAVAAPIATPLPPDPPNAETDQRGLVFGPDGLDELFAFPLHVRAARSWFAAQGVAGPHAYAPV